MDILRMDLQYGIHCAMLPDTYHTYILTIRDSLPDTVPWCSLVLSLVFPILRRSLYCNYDHVMLNLIFTAGEEV